MRAVVIGYVDNYKNSQRMRRYAMEAKANGAFLVCADSGGETALAWGLLPDLLIGDMDSIDPPVLAHYQAQSQLEIISTTPEKDETDLEMAINAAVARNITSLTIIGAVGGRLDHTLGNLYLLAMPKLRHIPAEIVAEQEQIALLWGGDAAFSIKGSKGDTVSLIPFNGDAVGIRTTNLYYPLRGEPLYFGPGRGISNVMIADEAWIEFDRGLLLVIHNLS